MHNFSIFILLSISTFLNIEKTPELSQGWTVLVDWQRNTDNYFIYSAANNTLVDECRRNPDHYIQFPSIIHSSNQVKYGNQIIASTSPPNFKHIRGFYGALIISCLQLQDSESRVIEWKVTSYSEYFSRFHYFPKLVSTYPVSNFFYETLNVIATGILITLCLLYIILFWGKISNIKLIYLTASNFFTAFYFIANTAELYGLSMPMLLAHKIADTGLWIGFACFIHVLYLEGLIPKWASSGYKIPILIAVIIICFARDGDTVQFGTIIPFLFTPLVVAFAVLGLMKKVKSKKEYIQLMALFTPLVVYFNDVFFIIGLADTYPLLPLGISATYVFILLSVNESIIHTYYERDQLKVLTQDLKKTNEDLKKAQDELIKSEKMALMGRAVARITHELNTPIYSARSASQNIQAQTKKVLGKLKSNHTSAVRDIIQQYQNDIEKMSTILISSISSAAELIRSFKEISVDQINVKKKSFRLLDYIEKSITTVKESLERNNIQIHIHGDNVLIYHDPSLFYQVIVNLITNARKYAYTDEYAYMKNKMINIHIVSDENTISLIFTDNGKGIPKENINQIYDAFFTTAGGKGGTGIGLNIVYNIVTKSLKGHISCDSVIGQKTEFLIKIPKEEVTE